MLVSDAMCAAGLDPGTYTFGEQVIEVGKTKALLAGTQTLAGR